MRYVAKKVSKRAIKGDEGKEANHSTLHYFLLSGAKVPTGIIAIWEV